MKLGDLVRAIPRATLMGPGGLEIKGITHDSREAGPGFIFVCVRGLVRDGHEFIPDAKRRGAVAVVVEREVPETGMAVVRVEDSREALALLASAFYGHPSKRLRVIGVTGTNGKTTTTHLVRAILSEKGFQVGLIGTIHNIVGGRVFPVERTTPEAHHLQGLFDRMLRAGTSHVVMEVSSHALELRRVDGTEFDVGIVTNVTQDHLDFHRTFQGYLKAKGRLFAGLGSTYQGSPKEGPKAGVINFDDPSSGFFRDLTGVKTITYGLGEGAEVRATDVGIYPRGVLFRVRSPSGNARLSLQLTGSFNIYNALAALGAALVEGVELEIAVRALESVKGIPGRFERVDAGQDFTVIVDYAHTPDSLENVLRTAREFTRRQLVVVFGCGGDRDRTKRPLMGEIATRYADLAIITSDNPRSEDPEAIIREIEEGARRSAGPGRYLLEADRARAIEAALQGACAGDVVVIAGKGHETYQIFKDRTIPFDDREVARQVLERMTG